jgi:monovalent cation:H+ antiporter-2, CPA2 family
VRTALTISASLAQIGEFFFILMALGMSLGLMPPEGRDLILAGALLSITLNPFAFATIDPIERWVRARPRLAKTLERDKPATDAEVAAPAADLRNHAVIVGYGRVGSVVGSALAAQGLAFVVIESNRRLVDTLRERDIRAIHGDAAAHGVLDLAQIAQARLLVIATPGGFPARRILELARERNPQIAVVVRTHSANELAFLIQQGVDHVVMGELELALEMTSYALRSFGVPDERCKQIAQSLRAEGIDTASADDAAPAKS